MEASAELLDDFGMLGGDVVLLRQIGSEIEQFDAPILQSLDNEFAQRQQRYLFGQED